MEGSPVQADQIGYSRKHPLDLITLSGLMQRTSGDPRLKIALIDGPVAIDHPALTSDRIREIPGTSSACTRYNSTACRHGTFVAGILFATRDSIAPAICPGCTLLVRPVFGETMMSGDTPSATPEEVAHAILDCLDAGARLVNVSAALVQHSFKSERALEDALDQATSRGAIVIVAAGNQGTLGSTSMTRHPGVIPVVSYDLQGTPMDGSNLGRSIGLRGLGAPGQQITSLAASGEPLALSGTSAATPFVTGAIALLWSEFPETSAPEMRRAILRPDFRRSTVVPPLLDAWASYQHLLSLTGRHNFGGNRI